MVFIADDRKYTHSEIWINVAEEYVEFAVIGFFPLRFDCGIYILLHVITKINQAF